MKIIAFAVLVWLLAICAHFFWEAWLIARSGFRYPIPKCRRWWCPHGLLNRFRNHEE
jgi:hypothetical protein